MSSHSKEERVHHVFEKIYDNYDSMNSIISFKRNVAWRKDVIKRINVKEDNHILDVCTGTGDWAIALTKVLGESGKVICLDISENMLKVAQDKQQQHQLEQLEFMHGN